MQMVYFHSPIEDRDLLINATMLPSILLKLRYFGTDDHPDRCDTGLPDQQTVHGDRRMLRAASSVWIPSQVAIGTGRCFGPAAHRDSTMDKDDVKVVMAGLTPRQRAVFDLMAAGRLNKQIAFELGITEATLKAHVSAILRKLGARDRRTAADRVKLPAGKAIRPRA